MLLLVVDTAGPTGGVLLAEGIEGGAGDSRMKIVGEIELHPRLFSAELIPAIAGLLGGHHSQLSDLDAFAVVSGPGSFTGLRVGLSAVKAMAEATGKPILTVSHLAVMAATAAEVFPDTVDGHAVHIVHNAGRNEFYYGIYRDSGKTRVAESFESLHSLTEKLQEQRGIVVVSEPAVKTALQSVDGLQFLELTPPTVREALPLAAAKWRAGEFHDPATVDANYLRRSDAVVVIRPKANPVAQTAVSQDVKL